MDNQEYPTYTDAAKARGLLDDDTHWNETLHEAALERQPKQMRDLFANLL